MSNRFGTLLSLALILGLAACSKNEPANAAATGTVAATDAAATKSADTSATPSTPATASESQAQKQGESEVQPTEQVAEVEEAADAPDQPVVKGAAAPPLKLAQLPPRAVATSHFKEGVNYQRLSPTQPVSVSPDQVQIVEFFWYGCPHCNALDPLLEAWRTSTQPTGKPPYVVFTRVPAAWNDITRFHGRFHYAAESLGRLDELHPLIFREIHEKGNPLNTIDAAREFFAEHGVSAQDFQKSFGALSLERKLDEANLLAQRAKVTGVPHFLINGKYITDVSGAGGPEQLLMLLNELAAREHAKE